MTFPGATPSGGAQRPSLRPGPSTWWRLVGLGLLLAAWVFAPARADEHVQLQDPHFEVSRADKADSGSTLLEAQFLFDLPASLREAVEHGVPLYFNVDLDVYRTRWYWFDKSLVSASIVTRLSYSPLTRQYRLTRGGLALPFESLDQALATLRRVVQWRIGDAHVLEGGNLHARLRLHLDASMLPRPFQVSALTDRDWSLDSDWISIPVRPNPASN